MIEPRWRVAAGTGILLGLILLLALLVGLLSSRVSGWPVLLQALFYAAVGIAWIAPLKPLIRWMQTGRFSA